MPLIPIYFESFVAGSPRSEIKPTLFETTPGLIPALAVVALSVVLQSASAGGWSGRGIFPCARSILSALDILRVEE